MRMQTISMPEAYISYLVRLWREPKSECAYVGDWQGEVEHIQSGHQWRFEDASELLTFLRLQMETADRLPEAADG